MPRIPDERPLNLQPSIASDLARILPAAQILTEEEELRPYECDGLTAFRVKPMVVVLPDTIEQIQDIVCACQAKKVPVVARGAGTGLSGGALPLSDAVILSLARFNQILSINPDRCTAIVQPGVRNLAISEAVAELGLYYAPDPSSQIACTIGGNVAENSGGVHCLKYGLTVHNILGLKVVGIDGELYEIGGETLDDTGLDLLALMTGSEGLLGIIVEVTVKLLPKAPSSEVLLASFDDLAKAGQAVADVIAKGITPAGFEMMDKPAINAAEDFLNAGYPRDAMALLICELDGEAKEVAQDTDKVTALFESAGATDIRRAVDEKEQANFWLGRKSAFPAVGRISPDYYCMDGTIPRKELANVLTAMAEMSKKYGLRVANVFHAGDGNLHPLILYDANQEGELERAEDFGAEILELCVQVGGTITGEHGVGIEKINQMCVQFNSAELDQMHAVKAAFDADTLLNPGKAVPTLHRCAEFGAIHVHNGKLPHPELPRY